MEPPLSIEADATQVSKIKIKKNGATTEIFSAATLLKRSEATFHRKINQYLPIMKVYASAKAEKVSFYLSHSREDRLKSKKRKKPHSLIIKIKNAKNFVG